MLRYKNVKQKSNYFRVNITAGTDYESNAAEQSVSLHKGECTLVFSLFPGEHTVSARYEAGAIGENALVGEIVVYYAYRHGRIEVCDYDFVQEEYSERNGYDIPPVFRLYRKTAQENGVCEEQPLLEVSSSRESSIRLKAGSEWMAAVEKGIKEQLRTIHGEIKTALKDTGIFLSVHFKDVPELDENGMIVGGTACGVIADWNGYFYNIDGSSGDNPQNWEDRPSDGSWLLYYATYISEKVPESSRAHPSVDCKYCASYNASPPCSENSFVGGHIWMNLDNQNRMLELTQIRNKWYMYIITGLSKEQHQVPKNPRQKGACMYDQNKEYYMLPICSWHNNTSRYNIVMHTAQNEDVMVLNKFRPNVKYL